MCNIASNRITTTSANNSFSPSLATFFRLKVCMFLIGIVLNSRKEYVYHVKLHNPHTIKRRNKTKSSCEISNHKKFEHCKPRVHHRNIFPKYSLMELQIIIEGSQVTPIRPELDAFHDIALVNSKLC